MDTTVIVNEMSALKKEYIGVELKKIYSQISKQVCTASEESFAKLFTALEARMTCEFYLNLERKARLSSYEAMAHADVPESDIPMLWGLARTAVSAPQARLCNEGNYTPPKGTAQPAAARKPTQEEKPHAPELGKWIVISGIVMEVLSWIFIPSYKAWAPIVRGIGLVMIGAGAYKVCQENKAPATIQLTEKAREREKEKAAENVKAICAKQFELNYGIYCSWLDTIISALAKECADRYC